MERKMASEATLSTGRYRLKTLQMFSRSKQLTAVRTVDGWSTSFPLATTDTKRCWAV